ncbi:hypothetical protein PCC9214_01245 [Planktothrix tepida]|uniref:Uncharacterized protein n=1 Tax=Planktothrix pseudagardhii TaxID=132604 RepID=A0A9W4CRR2_9CYAN|nr:hypothetical protein PCC9214_01245 [Planktothrix tepida]CAD5979501.1 hypothetical protein NO713_04535 [Planktothrix pseudagardhii]
MGLLPLESSFPPGYFGSLDKCYMQNLTFYRKTIELSIFSPCSFERNVIKSLSLLNIDDGSSQMFTFVILGQLAREILRYLTYIRFPVIPSFNTLIISLVLWELLNLFGLATVLLGLVIRTIDSEIDLPLRSHFQS